MQAPQRKDFFNLSCFIENQKNLLKSLDYDNYIIYSYLMCFKFFVVVQVGDRK